MKKNKKTLFIQTECETIAGVSQLTKYMRWYFNNITYTQADYGTRLTNLSITTINDITNSDRVILSPIMVSYMRVGEVPYVKYIDKCTELNKELVFMIHGSVKGITDDAWNILANSITNYVNNSNSKLSIWYVCHEYGESYKNRLPRDVVSKIEFNYCPFTSLGIPRIINEANLVYEARFNDPINYPDRIAMITRDTNNRVARFFSELKYHPDKDFHIIMGSNGEFNKELTPRIHYYLNVTDSNVKHSILAASKYYLSGSFYDDGLHIRDHEENGYDWSLIEAIANGCIILTTPEFHKAFENDGIYVYEYAKDSSFNDIMDLLNDTCKLKILSDKIYNNVRKLEKRFRKDYKIIRNLINS